MGFASQTLNIICIFLAAASVAIFMTNRRLESELTKLTTDAESLKVSMEKTHRTCPDKVVSAFPRIPATHVVVHREEELNGLDVEVNVTFILIYKASKGRAKKCFERQINAIRESFPKAKVLFFVLGRQNPKGLTAKSTVKRVGTFRSEGEALNSAIKAVETTYFMLIQPGFIIEPKGSDGSVEWLHHALVVTPGFDIIGGSTLLSSQELVIPCYSINFCNWTMTQNYEYARSYGEVMICDEVSHSFMGRADITKMFPNAIFDKKLDGFLYTDFFYRAKKLALTTANRPEVMFVQTYSCVPPHLSTTELIDAALPFSQKHNIFKFKDPAKKITSICEGSRTNICSLKNMVEKWRFPKWYESGMFAYPFVIEQAIRTLDMIADHLHKAHISYALRGETLFGAVMTKSVLPWGKLEAIQLWVFGSKTEILKFAVSNDYTHTIKDKTITLMVKLPDFTSAMKVELVVKSLSDKIKFVKIRMNEKFYPTMEDPIAELKRLYGENYLEGPDDKAEEFSCKLEGHHACLPAMARRGASTYREKYCEI